MLSVSIITLMATVLAGTAAAAPAEVKAVPAKEATAGTSSILAANVQFEVCRAINFNDCGIFLAEEFQCYSLGGTTWDKSLSSLRTRTAGFSCFIWRTTTCQGPRGGPIRSDNPHEDLRIFGWNDDVSSFMCIPS
ncbi:hypothetical protein MCOR27_004562 [Pyricularia oryzae]|uniref:Uncharacterized protein n=2 Tax=Pyricularia TaxID=48558 RepID=A0ABQ8NH46_PYRGI|nr:hypothetical protein MCOR01_007870 [Pyricularia oryzae]KAI6297014.1 hypothetical protein MCOR33_006557 [Pyricularia grisea]KAH9433471.1 hypothetical protein MCOR02_005520 [Pyricularia oryzae]KAI6254786.1 hypothetical protein MCOR19_008711 [Pyricularia oryzae]KAI6273665.1 hypothetical protein MCOR26_006805 [Pyricularia oryzae]